MIMGKERELNDFNEIFSFLKDDPVVLYGTGQYTELLLRELHGFHIIGLMDQNKTGQLCYGLRVMSVQEVEASGCKAVIIIANLSIAPVIYRRIEHLEENYGKAVYYMNGRRPGVAGWDAVYPPKALDEHQLFAKAQEYDVISFDLFDTLIMRKCLLPDEIFSIVAHRMKLDASFVKRRQEAEKILYHSGNRFFSLEDIYKQLGERAETRQMELDVELEMAMPRADMVRVYQRLRNAGKRVVITSDMYLSADQLKPMLWKCGIENAEAYISNECGASKHIGTLFHRLKADFPGKHILHIGDNPRCDVEQARQEGIDALGVNSASTWMESYGLDKLKAAVCSDAGRRMYELFAQKCFAQVSRQSVSGRILISDPKELGYLFFGPLAVGYLAWLVEQVQRQKTDHLLFISRDGHLFYQLYERLCQNYGEFPPASYFLTSRRCAGTASISTEADVRFVFENICYSRNMRIGETLEKVYGIARSADPMLDHTLGELDAEDAWICIRRHMRGILKHAAEERARYANYIDSLEISAQRIGIMNFVGRGVTQRCLQKILNQKLTGFYFAQEYDAAYILGEEASAFSWYPEPLSTHTGQSRLAEQLLLGETIFSAPHGAVIAFSDDGTPIYEPTKPERADLITACHQGIVEYMEDILQIGRGLDGLADTVELADAVFGLLCSGLFTLSQNIEAGLQIEDRFQ